MEHVGFYRKSFETELPMTAKVFSEGANEASLSRVVAFDIETYSPNGFPHNFEDPVVNFSLAFPLKGSGFLFISVIGLPDIEVNMLRILDGIFKEIKGFTLLTYNGAKFDIEYVVRRGRLFNLDFADTLKGVSHIDVYQLVKWLGVRLPSYSQKTVESALGIKRFFHHISGANYCSLYRWFADSRMLVPMFYNMEDAFGCLMIAQKLNRLVENETFRSH